MHNAIPLVSILALLKQGLQPVALLTDRWAIAFIPLVGYQLDLLGV